MADQAPSLLPTVYAAICLFLSLLSSAAAQSASDTPSPGDTERQLGERLGTAREPQEVTGNERFSVRGLDLSVNYAGNDIGRSLEARVSKEIEHFRLNLSQNYSYDAESTWAGKGKDHAASTTETSVDWALLSFLPVSFSMRETTDADGRDTIDLGAVQTLMLGRGKIVNSMVTDTAELATDETSGNLSYSGPVGPVRFLAGVDYGGPTGMRPTGARMGLERSVENSWSLHGYADRAIATGLTRLDVGASREIAGFVVNAFAGGINDGSAYAGLRLQIRLSPGSRDDRPLGF
jgi:hypothetical protein